MATRTVLAAAVFATALSAGTASATEPVPKESSLVGDAWVHFPADPENPFRRFIVNVHGNPWRIVDGRLVIGAARGTVDIDHYAGGEHTWVKIKADYIMATGPIAVISGLWQDARDPNKQRATLTFYQSPQGHRFDRVGFSWGVVNEQCQQMGTGPAPFSPAAPGPDGHWLKGYTIKPAPIALPTKFLPPKDPSDCKYDHQP
ncbi:hypothetical protein [Actinomadura rupiterrae]|uniref:hypothetical protein n=1 Tax=Actinomadura rupiterrae TaxID=559627 RepID=UPI0020A48D2B|nr:hypothetical protein [Actinomadura rupiterrae]MCP2335648.1 hypothetical protein [Actinomadura rupiterrae]